MKPKISKKTFKATKLGLSTRLLRVSRRL